MRCADRRLAVLAVLAALAAGCATPSAPERRAAPADRPTAARAVVDAPDAAASPEQRQLFEQALAHLKAGRSREAEQAFKSLTQRAPQLSVPHANLGILYHRAGRHAEAIAAFERAIEINPRRWMYYNELGIVYRQEGKFDLARKNYRKALDLNPDYALAHLNLAILADIYLQEPQTALNHYQRYQQLVPAEAATVSKWIIDLERRGRVADKKPKESS